MATRTQKAPKTKKRNKKETDDRWYSRKAVNSKIKKTAHSTNTNTHKKKKSQVNKEKGEKIAFEKVSQER